MEVVRTRLDALANIFERYHKPAKPPLLPQRYAIKYPRSRDVRPAHRFGGSLEKAIKCPQCGEDFCRVASFDARDETLVEVAWKRKSIVAALCPACSLFGVSSLTCVSYANQAPKVVQLVGDPNTGDAGELPARSIELSSIGPQKGDKKSRVGGAPEWIQGDETPDCPCCKEPMRFFAQFASDDRVTFGADMGTAYVLLCQPCVVVGVVIQAW